MSTDSKKMSMAEKMYDQNSKGGKGSSPKYKTNSTGKAKGKLSMKYTESKKGTTHGGGQPVHEANTKGSFNSGAKYKQANC